MVTRLGPAKIFPLNVKRFVVRFYAGKFDPFSTLES